MALLHPGVIILKFRIKLYTQRSLAKPPALSSKDYIDAAWANQEKKRKALEEKENRKKIREIKKRKISKKKESSDEETESDDENIEYNDTDDSNVEEDGCFACEGTDQQEDSAAWMGCVGKNCGNWFHRRCVSQEATQMSEAQIKRFAFSCLVCERKK